MCSVSIIYMCSKSTIINQIIIHNIIKKYINIEYECEVQTDVELKMNYCLLKFNMNQSHANIPTKHFFLLVGEMYVV